MRYQVSTNVEMGCYVWTIVVWKRCRREKVGGVDILCISSLGGADEKRTTWVLGLGWECECHVGREWQARRVLGYLCQVLCRFR